MVEAGIALIIFLLTQAGVLIWVLSNICTQLAMINETLTTIRLAQENFATKEAVARELTFRDSKIDAAWKVIDSIRDTCKSRELATAMVDITSKRVDEIEHRLNAK